MPDGPLVSVVIPTSNSGRTIHVTLESLRRQTYGSMEVIVVDRGSTDDTLRVVSSLCPGARVLRAGNERSSQKNAGAAAARGKYLYFVDSDFIIEPEVVAEAVGLCEAGHQAAVIHNTSDPRIGYWARVRKLERDCYFRDPSHVASRFVRADLFKRIGGFDETLISGEDYELHTRLLMAGARMAWCNNREYHVGEPSSLTDVIRKHIYYGKYILNYARRQFSYRLVQLSPLRASYVRNARLFLSQPGLLPGFLLYQYVRYASAIAGLVSTLIWPVTLVSEMRVASLAVGEQFELLKMVSIVVVTRNRPAELKRCVESLASDVRGGAELVVVDDSSRSGLDRAVLPEGTKLRRNPFRMYLSASRNIGAALASREYILFVDDDNVVGSEAVAQLAKAMGSFPALAVVSPVVLTTEGRIWYAGGWISPLSGLSVFRDRGYSPAVLPKRLIETRLFHNCFMMRREAFASIGGFDSTNFPMYLAEADASEKLQRLGYKAVVDPYAVVTHSIESEGVRSLMRNIHITEPARAYFVGRNRILLMKARRARLQYVVFLTVFEPAIALIHLLTIVSTRNQRYRWTMLAGPYVRGLVDGVTGRVRLGRDYARPSIPDGDVPERAGPPAKGSDEPVERIT